MTDSTDRARIKKAVDERGSLDGMRRAFETIIERQKENAARIPDLEQRKDRLRKTKEFSVGNERLFVKAVAALKENGFRVIVAKTAAAALKQIKDELKGQDIVVKSKSNVTKEIHLAEALEAEGIRVIETDLGDRIVQLAGCAAAHPTGPACHLTRKEIAALFAKHFGHPVSEDPMELTEIMREEIATYLSQAKVGITGANAITADEGAVVIVHNEGNAAKCSMVPDKHIVVTTPEKVVPSLEDALNVTRLQTYLATGKIISSYINIITGTSYTSDIEKKLYRGMHGPKDVVVVFVDDGRMTATDKEPQYCIGCGMCLLFCPTYSVIGPLFGSAGHMGGQGVYLSGANGRLQESVDHGLYLCTTCGACEVVCPAKIGTKNGISKLRGQSRNAGGSSPPEHQAIVASVRNYENPWQVPRKQKTKWAEGLGLKEKGEILYFAGCSTSLLFPDTARSVVQLMRESGTDPAYLGPKEKCCGSSLRKLGVEAESKEIVEDCFKQFKRAGAKLVVTSCPGCSSALKHHKELEAKYGIRVQHISQFLDEKLDKSALAPIPNIGTVTYHDPCDLGRELGVYDEPRALLRAVAGSAFVEMQRSRNQSACCGSGSGVKSAFPELASAIGSARIEMAKAVGAHTIVTSCPWCVQGLRECQGDICKVQVMDLVEVLVKSLSEENPSRRH